LFINDTENKKIVKSTQEPTAGRDISTQEALAKFSHE